MTRTTITDLTRDESLDARRMEGVQGGAGHKGEIHIESYSWGVSQTGLTKVGPGTLVLASANTYQGTTQVLGGTLLVSG